MDNYINSIIEISHNNLPAQDNWKSFTITAKVISKFVEIEAFYIDEDSQTFYFDPKYPFTEDNDEDLTFIFINLRKAVYEKNTDKGTWYTAEIEVNHDGEFSINFEYDLKPEFTYEPSDDKYIDDLNRFPRKNQYIPDWLKEIKNKK
ncbi:immunity protein YezG family protein [Flavobacterium enshiense]|uniref:immunity protein YezG family protein n=1 Tax=Flavobacterium enshiense TaxID=1341165 RepID=UPI00345DC517